MNEKDLQSQAIGYLKGLGISTIKENVAWKSYGNKSADIVGYIIESDGKLSPQVVVEIKAQPTPEAQLQLVEATKGVGAAYGLLFTAGQKVWYDSQTFLPVMEEPPVFHSMSCYLMNQDEISYAIERCFLRLRHHSFGRMPLEITLIASSLLVRRFLDAKGILHEWEQSTPDQFEDWLEEAKRHFEISDFVVLRNYLDVAFNDLIRMLSDIPPKHPLLGRIFLTIIESFGRKELGRAFYVTPPVLREMFQGIIKLLPTRGNAINLGSGYGSLLQDVFAVRESETIVGYEMVLELCAISQISLVICDIKNVSIHCADALMTIRRDHPKFDLVFMDPPIGRITQYRDYELFDVTDGGRKRADLSDLFVELAMKICNPNGYIVTVVPESVLFSSSSERSRQMMLDQCIVEAIFSLPTHTFKPYSTVKASVLVLRRKETTEQIGKHVFMAKIDSLDDIPASLQSFSEAKNRGDLV